MLLCNILCLLEIDRKMRQRNKLQLIIIAGCQRSGTTLIGQILGAHPHTFLIDEPDGLYAWFDAWLNCRKDYLLLFDKTIKKAASKYSDSRGAYRQAEQLENHTIVVKAPNLTYSFNELALIRPKPIIIYPVRDVRSVVASILKLDTVPIIENQTKRIIQNNNIAKIFEDELNMLNSQFVPQYIKAAIIWRIKTGLYQQFAKKGLNPFVIKYENIVNHYPRHCISLMEHCSLPNGNGLLAHHQIMKGIGPGNTLRNRAVDCQSLQKWEKQLKTNEVDKILSITENLMLDLGYNI